MNTVIALNACRPRRRRPLGIAVKGLNCMIDITLVIAFMRTRVLEVLHSPSDLITGTQFSNNRN